MILSSHALLARHGFDYIRRFISDTSQTNKLACSTASLASPNNRVCAHQSWCWHNTWPSAQLAWRKPAPPHFARTVLQSSAMHGVYLRRSTPQNQQQWKMWPCYKQHAHTSLTTKQSTVLFTCNAATLSRHVAWAHSQNMSGSAQERQSANDQEHRSTKCSDWTGIRWYLQHVYVNVYMHVHVYMYMCIHMCTSMLLCMCPNVYGVYQCFCMCVRVQHRSDHARFTDHHSDCTACKSTICGSQLNKHALHITKIATHRLPCRNNSVIPQSTYDLRDPNPAHWPRTIYKEAAMIRFQWLRRWSRVSRAHQKSFPFTSTSTSRSGNSSAHATRRAARTGSATNHQRGKTLDIWMNKRDESDQPTISAMLQITKNLRWVHIWANPLTFRCSPGVYFHLSLQKRKEYRGALHFKVFGSEDIPSLKHWACQA